MFVLPRKRPCDLLARSCSLGRICLIRGETEDEWMLRVDDPRIVTDADILSRLMRNRQVLDVEWDLPGRLLILQDREHLQARVF